MAPRLSNLRVSLNNKRFSPPALLASIYAVFILLGAIVLRLPVSHHGGITFSDALFTAASAVTVTGLIVVDTGSAFTLFGQIVITLLIQLGGLGLMTFAALLLSMLGLSIGMPQRMILRDELGESNLSDLGRLVRVVILVALICEAIGTLIMMTVFVPQFGWAQGTWQAIFHAVSAFNNAGFSLFPNSLMGYVGNPTINLTITFMFIIGGL
ncbi:potassium transporter TrkG [Marimonas sp. MJW-29]|uniref:Potassium transporter TrkG n=1 Tax=Sulfitobacter sediminis TaxID=3234186 RepID=A0ABV3RMF5_9RHOB